MAHAAAHLKKGRELEDNPEYRALQKARERRRRHQEKAERRREVKTLGQNLDYGFVSRYARFLIFYLFQPHTLLWV